MLEQGLGDDVAHRPARIETGIGILKNHLDSLIQRASDGVVSTVKQHAPFGWRMQTDQEPGQCALAATRFANDCERCATGDRKAHVVDRV